MEFYDLATYGTIVVTSRHDLIWTDQNKTRSCTRSMSRLSRRTRSSLVTLVISAMLQAITDDERRLLLSAIGFKSTTLHV